MKVPTYFSVSGSCLSDATFLEAQFLVVCSQVCTNYCNEFDRRNNCGSGL